MQVLIVDDDPIALDMMQNVVESMGHQVMTANNGREALKLMRTGQFRLVLSDWEMPEMDGLELCRQIRKLNLCGYVYFILITIHQGTQQIIDGLEAGADEFIAKPFDPHELTVRIRAGERILSIESRDLTIFTLAKLAESRDEETGAHVDRMREYCRVLAEYLSQQEGYSNEVDGAFIQLIYASSPLHDIGKVGIPDRILLKPGPLTADELEVMKQHTVTGAMTLDSAIYAHPEAKFLSMARDIARSHHERWDGSGYPDGLAGRDIPLAARIVGLAAVYDALTNKRIYKPAYCHETARDIILDGMGTQFDPDIVRAFLANEDKFLEIHRRYAVREERELRAMWSHLEPAMN